ncbi:MAG: NfeD family protein [Candidatus Aminicenantaceae bacterium]
MGEVGIAQTDLSLEGKVFVHGEIWKAVASENLPLGTKIKVTEVLKNLRLKVTKI